MTPKTLIRIFTGLAGVQFVFGLFIFIFVKGQPVLHATFGMALGLYVFWVIGFGLVTLGFKDPVRDFVHGIKLDWRLKFILFSTALALLEEVVTTTMTNAAPLFGVSMAQAHITASANYFDVVLTHSVVLFVPMFCIWAWLLSKYDIDAAKVFLLWGLSGFLAEAAYSGFQDALEIGLWVLVYGLMIYLPAYCVPPRPGLKPPSAWLYAPIVVGVIVLGVIPGGLVATLIKHLRPPHYFPDVH